MSERETNETPIQDQIDTWRERLRGDRSELALFTKRLMEAYDLARHDYAELEVMAVEIERQRDEKQRALRAGQRGVGGAAWRSST